MKLRLQLRLEIRLHIPLGLKGDINLPLFLVVELRFHSVSERFFLKSPIRSVSVNLPTPFHLRLNFYVKLCYRTPLERQHMYVVGSKSFRPDIQKPRQMENAVRDI